jgi:hypothetical protein
VGRNLTFEFRIVVAALCVALSCVFAGATAVSVVDKFEHSSRVAHDHAGQTALTVTQADHHIDHHLDGDQPDDNGQAGDHQSGANHHHLDAPVGLLNPAGLSGDTDVATQLTLSLESAEAVNGVRPGGLKRPPKVIASLD